ncbi:MAG: uracil-DNA glycosylase [Alphaproteobacteria bacterium]
MNERLQKLEEKCKACRKCELCNSRKNIVFSGGVPADVMLIGEAPGANEDEQGQPFIGRSGKLLDSLLAEIGLSREENIYICNTIKCRPPQNRDPSLQEKLACKEFLDAQIEIINPKVILLCGKVAVSSFIETKEPISKIRGKWFNGPNGAKMMPIYHPAYLLRSPSPEVGKPKWLMQQDLQEVKKAL